MSNEIQIFKNKEFGEIRTITIDENPWFILKDLMGILGLTHSTNLMKRLNKKGFIKTTVLTNGGKQSVWAVNESNMYKCVLRSNKDEAIEFENWITEEVLPTIRKTGMYLTDNLWEQLSNDPAKFGELLIDYGKTKDELKQVKAKNDILMHTEKTYTVTEIAKELGVLSARILNQILFKDHIQYMQNGTWVLYSSLQQENLIIINLSYCPEIDFKTFLVQIQPLSCLFQKNSSMTPSKLSKGS